MFYQILMSFMSYFFPKCVRIASAKNKRVSATKKKAFIWTVSLLLLAGGGWFLYRTGFFQAASSLEALRAYILRFAPFSHLIFFLLQLLSVVLAPIPSNITAAAGGALFGTWPAFLLTFAAVVTGSLMTFSMARALGRDFAGRLVSEKLSEKYQDVLRVKGPVFLTLAFLFPFFPDDMLCILAGLTGLPLRRFALIVVLARPWGLLFASALGGSALRLPLWAMIPIGLAGLALFLLGMRYGDRVEKNLLQRLNGGKTGKTE